MVRDRFDLAMAAVLVAVLVFSAVLLAGSAPAGGRADDSELNRRLEREMLYQARVAFIDRHFGPVVALRNDGALPDALFKLEELARKLPGEPHVDLLAGDIMLRMGQFENALPRLAAAVRGNADYVDAASPMSQRALVTAAVDEGLPLLRDRLRAQPDNASLDKVLKDGYYLQSRLAGGCE